MTQTPAVITPMDEHMGLDIARSLGPRGIPVFGLDPDPRNPSRTSKYCELVVSPDPHAAEDEYIQFLVDWGKKLGRRAVLYAVSDETVLLCARERECLEPYYEFVMPDYITMVKLSTKVGLTTAAKAYDIPAPQTIIPRDIHQVEDIALHLCYPVLLKPGESVYWHAPEIASLLRETTLSGRAKVVLCENAAELMKAYRDIARYDDRLIIQEVIPGSEENLAYISFYLDRQLQPLAMFAGRKLRVLPIGFGSGSYVRSFRDPDLERVALQLLSGVGYQGLGGLEFKKDPRDGRYKLIEFNTRFGMWDGLGVRCGVDTPYIAYRDTLHLPVEPQRTYRENMIWVDWQRDLRAFWMYHKQERLTLRQWLSSLRGEKMWAIYSWEDWKPGLAFTFNMLQDMWSVVRSGAA